MLASAVRHVRVEVTLDVKCVIPDHRCTVLHLVSGERNRKISRREGERENERETKTERRRDAVKVSKPN